MPEFSVTTGSSGIRKGCIGGLVALALFIAIPWALLVLWSTPRREPASDAKVMRYAPIVRAAYRTRGTCMPEAELEDDLFCPGPPNDPCIYYRVREGHCVLGYYVDFDRYFEYDVLEDRWRSDAEIRGSKWTPSAASAPKAD